MYGYNRVTTVMEAQNKNHHTGFDLYGGFFGNCRKPFSDTL